MNIISTGILLVATHEPLIEVHRRVFESIIVERLTAWGFYGFCIETYVPQQEGYENGGTEGAMSNGFDYDPDDWTGLGVGLSIEPGRYPVVYLDNHNDYDPTNPHATPTLG